MGGNGAFWGTPTVGSRCHAAHAHPATARTRRRRNHRAKSLSSRPAEGGIYDRQAWRSVFAASPLKSFTRLFAFELQKWISHEAMMLPQAARLPGHNPSYRNQEPYDDYPKPF